MFKLLYRKLRRTPLRRSETISQRLVRLASYRPIPDHINGLIDEYLAGECAIEEVVYAFEKHTGKPFELINVDFTKRTYYAPR